MNIAIAQPVQRDYGDRPTLAWIDKRKLIIDQRYQRSIESVRSQRLILYIREHFKWKKCLPLSVTDNGDNTWCVIDGQHRLAAVMPLADVLDMPCWNMGEMTLQEQAMAFVDINAQRVTVTPLAVFHAKAKAGDVDCRMVLEAVQKAGCRVLPYNSQVTQQKPGDLTCIGVLKKLVTHHGPELVTNVLRILRTAWNDAGGIRAEMLQGAIMVAAARGNGDALRACFAIMRPEDIMIAAFRRHAEESHIVMAQHVTRVILMHEKK